MSTKVDLHVPFIDLVASHREVADEIAAGWAQVLETADFAGGAAVDELEAAYAAYCGVAACAGVGSGTDALELALRAIGVGRGDEVVVPANSFVASAEAVSRVGARPVFADVDERTLLVDPRALEAAITTRTAAVMPVHLFGQLAPMDEIVAIARRAGVPVIEDAAQAQGALQHGRHAGTLGHVAATSFYAGKNLGAYGEAGAVTSTSPAVVDTVRALRSHGSERRYQHDLVGTNSRMDSLQAVVLLAKLRRLDGWNAARRAAAARYDELLDDVDGIELPMTAPGNVHAWHLYTVRVAERDRVLDELRAAGVAAAIHYPTPIHLTGAYADAGRGVGSMPVSEAAAARLVSLPMHPHLTSSQQERVADALRAAVRS
jgi:dTDP-4-amino-4,6-dideoxygalactose transaminase